MVPAGAGARRTLSSGRNPIRSAAPPLRAATTMKLPSITSGILPGLALSMALAGSPDAWAASGAEDAEREQTARLVQAHTTFLADDLLEGRGTATRGHALAARYVAAQFARLGLEPAGDDGGFEQAVQLIESVDDLEAGRLEIRGPEKPPVFTATDHFIARAAPGTTVGETSGAAVFVGFGVVAPELNHDDLAGLNLKGKVVVQLYGAPAQFPANPRAYHSDSVVKAREYVRRGAVGIVTVFRPRDEASYPWSFAVGSSRFPRMRLVDAHGKAVNAFPELKANALMNSAAATRLFAAAGKEATEVFAQAEKGQGKGFDLGFEVGIAGKASVRTVRSMNVVAKLRGTDRSLDAEPVLVTAHVDHVGIGGAVNGDAIYNGAMDNAVGTAAMLAVAESMARAPRPARSVIFSALTAEEKGLLGAEHLARHLPTGTRRFAANINLDMPLFTAPVRDLIVYGAEHSTLGATAAKVAGALGWTISPDTRPDEVLFIRSDQYPFVESGVPAIFLGTGPKGHGAVDLAAANDAFLKTRYHKPSDDLTQPIDWPSAGAFAEVATGIVRAVAEHAEPPRWYTGDFFGNRFAPPETPRASRGR